uniref:HcsA n=1 Tax=Haemophilus influenzae TaxID=727 RepID=I6MCR4_HAEIF|nr:HcsA [Haemophilus influenzae]
MVARNLALFPLFLCPQPIRMAFFVFRSKLILPCSNVEKRCRFFQRPKSKGVIIY